MSPPSPLSPPRSWCLSSRLHIRGRPKHKPGAVWQCSIWLSPLHRFGKWLCASLPATYRILTDRGPWIEAEDQYVSTFSNEVLSLYLKHGGDPNHYRPENASPPLGATLDGNLTGFEMLLDAGADLDFHPDGVKCTIRIPIEDIVEPRRHH